MSGPAARRLIGCALLLASALPIGLAVRAAPAAAAASLTKVQQGPALSVSSGSVFLYLPTASTAGTLLVATVASDKVGGFTAPAGWQRGTSVSGTTSGEVEVWYYPANPGGISVAAFGNGATHFAGGQLTEWSGASASGPLDVSATAVASTGASLTVTSTAASSAPGELGISAFLQTAGATLGAGPGWAQLGTAQVTRGGNSFTYASDSRNSLAQTTVSENESSSKSAAFLGVIATFAPPCSTGGLALATPGSVSLGALTLSGTNQTSAGTATATVDDETNSYSGWNLQLSSTLLTNSNAKTLPSTAVTITGATASPASGSCIAPTNTMTYPLVVPSAANGSTAAKVFSSSASTGVGPNNVTLNTALSVPADTYSGSYSATWTFTVASGP